jgi:hypothetical protein
MNTNETFVKNGGEEGQLQAFTEISAEVPGQHLRRSYGG